MRDGFIKCGAVTPDIRPADCAYNRDSIIKCMEKSREQDIKLLVFPELCITGSTCGDLLNYRTLLRGAADALGKIVIASKGLNTIVVVGLPVAVFSHVYSCSAVVYEGRILAFIPKNYRGENLDIRLPGLDGEYPFGSRLVFECTRLPEFRFAVQTGGEGSLPTASAHVAAGAAVIANPSSSSELVGSYTYRKNLIMSVTGELGCAYISSNAGEGESTTDEVFSGCAIIGEDGKILAERRPFGRGLLSADVDVFLLADSAGLKRHRQARTDYQKVEFTMELSETQLQRNFKKLPFVPEGEDDLRQRCEDILTVQAHGLKRRIFHTGCKSIVLGVSGGLDSTLAMIVAARALDLLGQPRKQIMAVTMPCFGTTERTRTNAELLAEKLGASFMEIDISESVGLHFRDIGHRPDVHDVTYENAQARERTQVLMDLANMHGGLVVGTGDLSELALGWATYNGDHMSMYGVNSSVPKTLVRHLVKYSADIAESNSLKDTLYSILSTPVSPELLPPAGGRISQITEGIVGPYILHDFFLYHLIRRGCAPSKVLRIAEDTFADDYNRQTILKWLKVFISRFFAQQFKRSSMPDGPGVGTVSFSPRGAWRMPSDASAALWLADLNE